MRTTTMHVPQEATLATHDAASDALALSSALLASVSHDLRNPLSVIQGAAEVLQARFANLADGDHHDYLLAIRRECMRMDEYVQGLLQSTRLLVGGSARMVREWIAVDALVASAVARLLRYRDGARVRVDIGTHLSPVRAHGALLEQALLNVLDNASKFSPPGAVVEVRVRQDHTDLHIDVVDAGPGISPERREQSFDYFASHDPQAQGRTGSGLGLAISRSILRAHGGDVVAGARTDDATGTHARLSLPVRDDA